MLGMGKISVKQIFITLAIVSAVALTGTALVNRHRTGSIFIMSTTKSVVMDIKKARKESEEMLRIYKAGMETSAQEKTSMELAFNAIDAAKKAKESCADASTVAEMEKDAVVTALNVFWMEKRTAKFYGANADPDLDFNKRSDLILGQENRLKAVEKIYGKGRTIKDALVDLVGGVDAIKKIAVSEKMSQEGI